ncbi:MAG: AbrB/MazE/SpoVT family DNA-binding domain-containing protein [Hyphomicrobiales bacterium]
MTIPIHIREQLGLLPGTEVEWEIDGEVASLRRANAKGRSSERGRALIEHLRLAGRRGRAGMTTDEIMALTRGDP